MHRHNVAGERRTNKFMFKDDKVLSYDNNDIVTNITSQDFNTLYPSVSASLYNENNPYTNHIMHMPGRFYERTLNKEYMQRVVQARNPKYFFFVSVKGEFPTSEYNKIINFPPILRQYYVEKEYDKLLCNQIPKNVKKLTQLLSTMDEFMTFSQYQLWFLMDLGFVITEYQEMDIFRSMMEVNFNEFIVSFMQERIKAKIAGKKGLEQCCKIILNGSYGKYS
jgi:hypothetical protein